MKQESVVLFNLKFEFIDNTLKIEFVTHYVVLFYLYFFFFTKKTSTNKLALQRISLKISWANTEKKKKSVPYMLSKKIHK